MVHDMVVNHILFKYMMTARTETGLETEQMPI